MNNCVKMKLGGSYCTHYKPYVTYQLLLVWEAVQEDVRDGRGGKKNEGWRSKGWLARQEERKNFSMMKQSALLSDWTRLPPMGGPAPWQQALSPRENQPYPSTPPYFFFASFLSHDPRLSPITKLNVFIIGYSCKDKNDTHRHTEQHRGLHTA